MRRLALTTLLLSFTWTALLVAIPLYSWDLLRNGEEKHYVAWFSGGACVLLCFPITMREIYMHLSHWQMPHVQRYVVRILWMVPIYAVESWLALRFKEMSFYISTLRECYEAYVIFCFMYFLLGLLGNEEHLGEVLRSKNAAIGNHFWPLKYCLNPWLMGQPFLSHAKLGVLQYVAIKNLAALTKVVLEMRGLYGADVFSWKQGYVYVVFLENLSQTWALYALVKFYYATKDDLAPWRPVGKFLCVKMVIFFTWWQDLMISILQSLGWIQDVSEEWTKDNIGHGLQDWLICVEMLVAAVAHQHAFTYKDFIGTENNGLALRPLYQAFLESTVPDDMFADLGRAAAGRLDRKGRVVRAPAGGVTSMPQTERLLS
ncbi:unnamed protein product [Discosporangium mesarthrocarpum]